jgi:hypothetical protein
MDDQGRINKESFFDKETKTYLKAFENQQQKDSMKKIYETHYDKQI